MFFVDMVCTTDRWPRASLSAPPDYVLDHLKSSEKYKKYEKKGPDQNLNIELTDSRQRFLHLAPDLRLDGLLDCAPRNVLVLLEYLAELSEALVRQDLKTFTFDLRIF